MAVTQMIIVAFAVTVFLIGAILGLRFRVCVLIAVVFLSLIVIVAFGLLHGKSLGFIFLAVFFGITVMELGYFIGAIIGYFFELATGDLEDSPETVVVTPRIYRRLQPGARDGI
ncbi:MAG: hypothetical protein WA366_29435 [Pseudolabrys sp.]|jgi:hypothetical protein